jgi:hypothetical protein
MTLMDDLVPRAACRDQMADLMELKYWDGAMIRRDIGRAAFGIFVIFSATAFGLLGGFGIKKIAILSIGGGGVFYATMWLIDRPPT